MSDTPKSYESDTPETQEAVERWRQGKINIFDEMARLERERDKAQALVAEMKQAIVWARAEAKERLHRLDQAACERRTWLEAHEKMKRERNEWKQIAERSIGYVYENDWDPSACDVIKAYEEMSGGPHPIHSR